MEIDGFEYDQMNLLVRVKKFKKFLQIGHNCGYFVLTVVTYFFYKNEVRKLRFGQKKLCRVSENLCNRILNFSFFLEIFQTTPWISDILPILHKTLDIFSKKSVRQIFRNYKGIPLHQISFTYLCYGRKQDKYTIDPG